jgi:predicted ester cyclase
MNSSDAKSVVLAMVEALNKHVIDGQEDYWQEDAVWRGPAGAGVKENLRHFQDGWQRPFLEAFPDKMTVDELVIGEGEYAAAMGSVTATHAGEFMGAEGSGKTINLKYMDFWKVQDGKIVENWVLLDVVDFFRQIGVDLLDGKGWDNRGRKPTQ